MGDGTIARLRKSVGDNTRGIRPELAAGLLALYTAFILNVPFWRELTSSISIVTLRNYLFVGATAILAIGLLWSLFGLLAWPRLFKPAAILLLFIASAAVYHTQEFGTLYDRHMIANILETDRAEARDLINLRMLLRISLMAGIPALLLLLTPIRYRPFAAEARAKLIGGVAVFVIIAAATIPLLSSFIPVFREHAKLRYQFAPINVISGLVGHLKPSSVLSARARAMTPIVGRKNARWANRAQRSVTVIVLGETARARNFSLNGYRRPTNPGLAAIDDVISFKSVESCGTATAQSVPCMFSDLGMARFSTGAAAARENVLDVLQHAGFSLLWRDNQSGCKGVCLRIPNERTNIQPKEFYKDSDTLDTALLDGLDAWIDGLKDHGVVVLHMMGSHGPAYYKRYDDAKAPFHPTCKTAQFSNCTPEALINTYDNTIHYTDYILSLLIKKLQAADARGTSTAMLYLSDHGESLGENGLYLHGLPRAIAPTDQTHVPWISWLSPRFRTDTGVDLACLKQNDTRKLSHDNLFHSVLGLLDVDSAAYKRNLDAFADCRPAATH